MILSDSNRNDSLKARLPGKVKWPHVPKHCNLPPSPTATALEGSISNSPCLIRVMIPTNRISQIINVHDLRPGQFVDLFIRYKEVRGRNSNCHCLSIISLLHSILSKRLS